MAIYKCDNSTEVGADKKADPGAFIPYNNDDDDEDGTLDRLDPDEDTPGEDDLIKVDFLFSVPLCAGVYNEGYVVIRRENANIKLLRVVIRCFGPALSGGRSRILCRRRGV